MPATKTEEFSVKDNRISLYAKAFSHPARVAILRLLLKKGTCICGEIVEELPLSQSTVSQHLRELKQIGLIRGEIEGPRICYCIDETEWQKAKKHLLDFFELYTPSNGKCC